jgi:hypothetical protein
LHAFKFNFELKLNFGHKFEFRLSTYVGKLHENTFQAMHLDLFGQIFGDDLEAKQFTENSNKASHEDF